jgi:hypothetical protein
MGGVACSSGGTVAEKHSVCRAGDLRCVMMYLWMGKIKPDEEYSHRT